MSNVCYSPMGGLVGRSIQHTRPLVMSEEADLQKGLWWLITLTPGGHVCPLYLSRGSSRGRGSSLTLSSGSAGSPGSSPSAHTSILTGGAATRGFWGPLLTGSSFPFLPFFPFSFSSLAEPADYRRPKVVTLTHVAIAVNLGLFQASATFWDCCYNMLTI